MTKSGTSKIQLKDDFAPVLSGYHGGGLVFVDPDLLIPDADVHPCHPNQNISQKCSQFCFPYPGGKL